MNPRRIFWACLKKVLFLFDAERVHVFAVHVLKLFQICSPRIGYSPIRILSGASDPCLEEAEESLRVHVMGMDFISPIGLAAGFDKDAEIVQTLPHLGFGFAEIGTVTPLPQPGNERPRLFRDPAENALFNSMGFNGLGAAVVAGNLAHGRSLLPSDFRVGVNIGKNKQTPLEKAPLDYARAASFFEGLADYLVINVSSPNTPGLRQLQTSESLKPIIEAVLSVVKTWPARPPVLLKLAPELDDAALDHLIQTMEASGMGGWVLTNTLGGQFRDRSGGWSGAPLTELSRARLLKVRSLTRLPIISVGGIMDPEEALLRLDSGADLIQIYTGWIYRGLGFPAEIGRKLRREL
ncbi:MAG: dihydroorotate dehydrogenase (quinone) [Bdellovibrionales bacterium GWB1_52_6]|nr:MAG: dihydroorotate dehydrogenase (quinone) [Bdellovibrionales bacterium GWB1_52_6]OFZ06182.1 MAG: dihydroorotate dehydrogenase (quinone) [Bdellovibrionales bacterium GWA1_52_35]HCM41176.1 dihydroorotate dehydrogenase (quinone) [Bdellovibrionales bacterium]